MADGRAEGNAVDGLKVEFGVQELGCCTWTQLDAAERPRARPRAPSGVGPDPPGFSRDSLLPPTSSLTQINFHASTSPPAITSMLVARAARTLAPLRNAVRVQTRGVHIENKVGQVRSSHYVR